MASRRGPQRRRRIDGHRRIDAGHQGGRRQASSAARSTAAGALVMRAEKVGRDTMLAQIVAMVADGAALARADPAHGRRVAGWFVPAVIVVALRRLRRLGDRSVPSRGFAYAHHRGRHGPDHRLSLRAWPRDADVDHGRHRPRRRGRRADQDRRGARAVGEGRHPGRRQDRHADRGQAEGRRRRARATGSTEADVLRLAASVERASEHPLAARDRRCGNGAQASRSPK